MNDKIADAIQRNFSSFKASANVVDVLDSLANATSEVARNICADATPGEDATGGRVDSLTEAVMGVTAGLVQIASAISDLAEAVRETKQ